MRELLLDAVDSKRIRRRPSVPIGVFVPGHDGSSKGLIPITGPLQ
jgi:hypothetical protein